MAFFKIHSSFWSDPDLEDWTPDLKYFYLYLITNEKQSAVGVMAFSLSRVAFDLGWSKSSVEAGLTELHSRKKLILDEETKELYVVSFYKYNKANTQKHKEHVSEKIKAIKSDTIRSQVIVDVEQVGTEVKFADKPEVLPDPSKKPLNIPFEDVWSVYRKGVRSSASRLWSKLSDEERLSALEFCKHMVLNREEMYRPYLDKILKQKQWISSGLFAAEKTEPPRTDKLSPEQISSIY